MLYEIGRVDNCSSDWEKQHKLSLSIDMTEWSEAMWIRYERGVWFVNGVLFKCLCLCDKWLEGR